MSNLKVRQAAGITLEQDLIRSSKPIICEFDEASSTVDVRGEPSTAVGTWSWSFDNISHGGGHVVSSIDDPKAAREALDVTGKALREAAGVVRQITRNEDYGWFGNALARSITGLTAGILGAVAVSLDTAGKNIGESGGPSNQNSRNISWGGRGTSVSTTSGTANIVSGAERFIVNGVDVTEAVRSGSADGAGKQPAPAPESPEARAARTVCTLPTGWSWALSSINASGASSVRVPNATFIAPSLSVIASGATDVHLPSTNPSAGSASANRGLERLSIRASGASDVRGGGYGSGATAARSMDLTASGAIGIHGGFVATQSLDVSASGASNVHVSRTPQTSVGRFSSSGASSAYLDVTSYS